MDILTMERLSRLQWEALKPAERLLRQQMQEAARFSRLCARTAPLRTIDPKK